jgi:hypothetical protein
MKVVCDPVQLHCVRRPLLLPLTMQPNVDQVYVHPNRLQTEEEVIYGSIRDVVVDVSSVADWTYYRPVEVEATLNCRLYDRRLH